MRNLLHATDRDRLVAQLRGPLRRQPVVGQRRLLALAETAEASFCAAADNGRAAELLVQPEIRDADPEFADGVLDFVMAMADAALPCRRAAAAGLVVVREDPRDFEILTPFHRFTGDLSAGLLRQELCGRGAGLPPVLHSGNLVEFRIGRHRSGIDAEDTIADFGVARSGDRVRLHHQSRIAGQAGLLLARPVPAGTLRYDYELDAASPVLRLTVTFTAEAQALARLRVSSAVDQLDTLGLDLGEGMLASGEAWHRHARMAGAGGADWADAVPVAHVALGTEGWPAGTPTLHLRPAEPAGVLGVKVVAGESGAPHWLILRHGPVDLPAGGSLVVREDRLFALGTPPELAARLMAAPDMAGLDFDPAAVDGAGLNAVAAHLLFDQRGSYRLPLGSARVATLAGWLDRHLAQLAEGRPALIDLAFATLAAEARLRQGADAAALLDRLVGQLLDRRSEAGVFGEADGMPATLASHAVALLALARALPHAEARPLASAIERAVDAVSVAGPEPEGGLLLAGGAQTPADREGETIGLVARAAGTVVLAAEARPGRLAMEVVLRAHSLHRQAIGLARKLVRPSGATLEVAASALGGPANPAGQAAVALALLAPDAALLRKTPRISA